MDKVAGEIIIKYNLIKHPEGGYFSETYRSKEKIRKIHLPKRFSGYRHFSTAIYYLLTGNDFSCFHRLNADEVWHFYSGSSLILYVISPKGNLKKIVLGNESENTVHQYTFKHNHWLAGEVSDKNSYSFVGCTVSPGFEYEDFEPGQRNDLIKKFPRHRDIIKKFTRI